jgi:peptidoglycan/xylan/chitin deacetylase (PgdA/CDA1 family)
MTWGQLEECQQWNITFGSHTTNHARLTTCNNEILIEELQSSLSILRARLDGVLPALAYPGGYNNIQVRQAVCASGYTCALGASSHWGNGYESDWFQLRRERFHQ